VGPRRAGRRGRQRGAGGEPRGPDGGGPPSPSPLQASLLALLGLFLASLVAVLLSGVTSPTTAAGVGTVVGIGAAGALGAAHMPPPHAERLGLRGLRLAQLPPLALLVPVALLAAQLDPLLSQWLPAPDAPERAERMREGLPTDERLALLETLVVAVGLAPLVEEWLFRGVIQQGLVARLGAGAGIGTTALLFAIAHGGGGLGGAGRMVAAADPARAPAPGSASGPRRRRRGLTRARISG
jgi:membrane protease YdiL (CAAX protease family)